MAADIVRTATMPNWTDISQLGEIAVIRTSLNYFLARDVNTMAKSIPLKALHNCVSACELHDIGFLVKVI